MSVDYKQKNNIPDLYNILGLTSDVCKEANCDEIIQKAYVKKAKVCHPDKHPGRKDVAEVFELLTSAYDILRDEKQRSSYNNRLSITKQSSNDFSKLKKATTEYAESLGEFKPATDQQKISFKEQMKILDSKHGYDAADINPISKQDAKKRMLEITKNRAVQDVEFKPIKIFEEGEPFNPQKFNAAFDIVHERNDGAILAHNGVPSAWNDMGAVTNYSSFDNLDNLYVEDNNRFDTGKQTFASVDFGAPAKKITKADVKNLKGADYFEGHNVLGDDYYKQMKEKLSSRKSDASNFESMKYNDFDRSNMAGYGIFDQLGITLDDRLTFDADEEDISIKFERIMAERQKESSQCNDKIPSNDILNSNKNNIHKKSTQNKSWR